MPAAARLSARVIVAALAWVTIAHAQDDAPARVDFLSFAQGALPLRIGGDPAARTTFEHAVRAVDGANTVFAYTNPIDPKANVELVYELPMPTIFDRFAVPNVRETPSPAQTFAREVTVLGSAESADTGFVLLASAALTTHAAAGQESELTMEHRTPVRWVKVVLGNGIDVQRDRMVLEFSEIIGNGTQEPPGDAAAFDGGWRGRGVAMLLRQDEAVVSGCYDRTGDLEGTVTGRILRATGTDRDDGTKSAFIAIVDDGGTLKGVRSTNGAPFRLFEAEPAADTASLACREPEPPVLGCGSVIHGIRFAFDSAEITPDSAAIIARLHAGLAAETGAIVIEGHTSSEGAEAYNQSLSERRAQAVVAELVARGVDAARLSAAGLGETRPIATNADESGRSLNRRVEIHCRAP